MLKAQNLEGRYTSIGYIFMLRERSLRKNSEKLGEGDDCPPALKALPALNIIYKWPLTGSFYQDICGMYNFAEILAEFYEYFRRKKSP